MQIRKTGRLIGAAVAAVGLVGGSLVLSATPAGAKPAHVKCEDVFPNLKGTLIFHSNPGAPTLLGNCHEHFEKGTVEPAPGNATVVDCNTIDDFAAFEGHMVGIQVITPSGGVYTNCKPHFMTDMSPQNP